MALQRYVLVRTVTVPAGLFTCDGTPYGTGSYAQGAGEYGSAGGTTWLAGKKLVVTVHWMDGKTDVFDGVDPVHEADGVLTIRERKPWWSAGSARAWNLPLANIRTYSADWVKRQ